jgi:hypothetical protein
VISLKRLFGNGWLHKSQRLRIVAVNGVRYKRLLLQDAYTAAEIERNLEAFGTSPRLPRLVTRFENELWLEFVPGEPLAQGDDSAAAEVADFYAEIYAKATRPVAVADTPLPQRLERDLHFLRDAGVIGMEAWRDLSAAAQRLQPPTLATGFEYTDPVLKNFVRPAGGAPLCAIDVESIVRDRPLGAGIAKAAVFWLTAPQRELLLARLDPVVPQLRPQMPYVELYFLARWVKTKFLTGKRKHAHEEHFKPFRGLG